VVWRDRDDGSGVEVALVHRPKYDDWSLPKGKLEPSEPAVVGACREVLEETGLRVVAGRTLGRSRYRVVQHGREVPKTVQWWSLHAQDGAFTPGDEVDALRWLAPGPALALLTAGHDGEPLRRFLTEPPRLRLLLLVRHARAGRRQDWAGEDHLRPLDERGSAQAEALARLLTCYAPERLLSAPLVRCVDTLRPLSAATGLEVQHDPLLGGEAYLTDPARTQARLHGVLGPGATVACTQGEVVPDAVRALLRDGRSAAPERWEAPKGSVWALAFADDGCVVDAHLTTDAIC
jgi:8-oxo-dGTP diphosphatase